MGGKRARKQGNRTYQIGYEPGILENGDSVKKLLVRSIDLLFKSDAKSSHSLVLSKIIIKIYSIILKIRVQLPKLNHLTDA
jgi:hypothetical protein